MDKHLTTSVKISSAVTIAAGASGSTDVNGSILDMLGFGSVCATVLFGPITAGAATSIKFQEDDDAAGGTMADIAGSAQTVADTADNTIFVTDHIRPSKRYVRVVVSRATQASTCAAIYQQYNAQTEPVTQPAGVTVERFKDAIAGTA